eukprot:2313498-Ditylum_brightwellii.AAC.1
MQHSQIEMPKHATTELPQQFWLVQTFKQNITWSLAVVYLTMEKLTQPSNLSMALVKAPLMHH